MRAASPRNRQGDYARRRARRGTAAVELAVTMPVLLTILLGVWDVGRLVDAYQVVANAAREAARQASAGQQNAAAVRQVVLNSLATSGVSTTGVTVTVTNLTDSTRTDPSTATQLDRFKVVVTLPSNNVRWVVLNSLVGPSSVTASATWMSMRDIPLSVPASIPVN